MTRLMRMRWPRDGRMTVRRVGLAPPMCVNVATGEGNRSACRVALQFPNHGTGVSYL